MGLDNPFYQPLQITVMLPRQTPVVKHRDLFTDQR
jgi:hypothetical protein